MAVQVYKGRYPHTGWVDLEGKGVLSEVAVVKNSGEGLYYIKLQQLDAIDMNRLFRILTNRNSHLYELWDLMSNVTLGNGANALEYFHQYVKVITPSGQIMNPQIGRVGMPTPRVAPRVPQQEAAAQETTAKTTTTKKSTAKKSTSRKSSSASAE